MIDIVKDPITGITHPHPNLEAKPRVVVLLDESGSMGPWRADVVSTFNEFVQSVQGKAESISLYTFDSEGIREKIRNEAPGRIRKLTMADYVPNSLTPLYDAMGKVMQKYEDDPHPIQFVTHTDGAENHSKEWTYPRLKEYIDILTGRGWLFVYLGEGLEGQAEVEKFQGLKVNFSSNHRLASMDALSDVTSAYAATRSTSPETYTKGGGDSLDIDEIAEGRQGGISGSS